MATKPRTVTFYKAESTQAEFKEYTLEEKAVEGDEITVAPGSLDLTKKRESRLLGTGPISPEVKQRVKNGQVLPTPKAPPGGHIVNDPQEELRQAFQAHRQAQSIKQRLSVSRPLQQMSSQSPQYIQTTTTNAQNIKIPPSPQYGHVGDVGTLDVPLLQIAGAEFQKRVTDLYSKHAKESVNAGDIFIQWLKAGDEYVIQNYFKGTPLYWPGMDLREKCTKDLGVDIDNAKKTYLAGRDKNSIWNAISPF